jgi:nucleoside-diphosphate-sugar epimerase
MTEPVDYGAVAAYLGRTRGMPAAEIATPYRSNLLDNAKARLRLGWTPKVNFEALIERAWNYQRDPSDPRKIWYPG